jgi:hypothetical protein
LISQSWRSSVQYTGVRSLVFVDIDPVRAVLRSWKDAEMSLLLASPIRRSTQLRLELPSLDGGPRSEFLVVVKNCAIGGSGGCFYIADVSILHQRTLFTTKAAKRLFASATTDEG